MLSKNQRLTGNRIEYLFKKGKKSGNTYFTIIYSPSRNTQSRFCVIVSTKIFAKAVQRNRLRRQIYEIFRLHPELPSTPVDLVVIAKTALTKLKFQELSNVFIKALQHLT